MWRSVSGCSAPRSRSRGASPINAAKRAPSSVADIATSRRSGRSAACASSASARPKSLSRLRSCTSSNRTADTPASSGSAWMRLTEDAFGHDDHAGRDRPPRIEPRRVADGPRRPVHRPGSAIRSAAARAARRRGEAEASRPSTGARADAGATAVVLPAPGGATSTVFDPPRRASRSGRTAWIGRAAGIGLTTVRTDFGKPVGSIATANRKGMEQAGRNRRCRRRRTRGCARGPRAW